ncbi:MAG: amidohydrolase family protein [Vicinamibacterales bacterium]
MRAFRVPLLAVALAAATTLLVLAVRGQAGAPISLLISGGTVVTMNAAADVLEDGAVAIAGDKIVEVGSTEALTSKYQPAARIDARGQVILPGLINTHTHAPMVLYRGLADDLALNDWLEHHIFPAEAKTVSPDFVRVGARLAALEMIESGTTTFADMYYFEDDIAEVTREAGLRGVLGQSVIQFPVADAKTPEEGLARAEAFIKKWKDDPLITPAVAPHAPTTVQPETLKAARALANTYGVPLLIHLAETRDEVNAIQAAHHASPTQYLESLGLWQGRSLAAHGVWLDDADMKTLATRGVGVAHNPESNMKLASGIAAVPKWLAAGMRAGLGTDGAASNNDLDMFEAMRVAALLQKVATMDPRTLPARQALELATRRGAEALGLGAVTGSLEAGKQADVITVTMDGARQTPMYDAMSHLVYVTRGDDVRTTVVAGHVLMRDGQVLTLNRADVLRDARAMAGRVRAAFAPAPAREKH